MIWTLLLVMSTSGYAHTMAAIPIGYHVGDQDMCMRAARSILTVEGDRATIRAYCVNGETGEVIKVPDVE
jgi:hypothetical protein